MQSSKHRRHIQDTQKSTHVAQSSSVNDQNKSSWPITVISTNNIRHTGIDALKGVLTMWVGRRLHVLVDALVLENTALREELFNGTKHLRIYGPSIVFTTSDNDDIIFTSDEVRTMSDSCIQASQQTRKTCTLSDKQAVYSPMAVSSLSPVATQILIPATLRSAMVSGTPS